jgi:hypothetical protein
MKRQVISVVAAVSLTGLLSVTALAATTAAGTATPRVKVTLSVDNTEPTAGAAVSLLARAAALPRGDRLLVQRLAQGASVWSSVAECGSRVCAAQWTEANPATDAFRAIAIKRKHGEKGAIVKTLGASRAATVTWNAPTVPPPTSAATPGHYAGTTADNELWAFDIGTDGLSLTNLQTGQVNESCNPADITLAGGNLSFGGPFPVAVDGSFSINTTLNGTVDGNPSTVTIAITGHVSGGSASGTYRDDTSFTYNGTAYGCSSGNQTWTASKT